MIVYLIRAHASTEYRKDEEAQRRTWAENEIPGYKVLWLYGDEFASSVYVVDRKLYVPCKDDMSNMLRKVVLGMDYVINEFKPNMLVVTTTNTYWDFKKTQDIQKKLERKQVSFGGNLIRWIWGDTNTIRNGALYASGPSMFFLPKTYNALRSIPIETYVGLWDDAAISHYLLSSGFKLVPIPRNNFFAHHVFVPRAHIRVKGVVNLKHNRERMSDIAEYFNSKGILKKLLAFIRIELKEFRRINDLRLSRIPSVLRRELSRAKAARGKT